MEKAFPRRGTSQLYALNQTMPCRGALATTSWPTQKSSKFIFNKLNLEKVLPRKWRLHEPESNMYYSHEIFLLRNQI